MSALRTIGLRFLIIFVTSFDVSADDILSQLFKTEMELAGHGNAAAMYLVGTMYEEGTGVEQNGELALIWYRKAAALGNRDAEAKLLSVNMKKGAAPTKADAGNKAVQREQARANELEAKLARERQAAEKARQEAGLLKSDAARVKTLEEQLARDRVDAEKMKEADEKSRRLSDKNSALEEQLKREKAEAEKARVEAEKARFDAENTRLLGEGLTRGRVPAPFPLSPSESTDSTDATDSPDASANSHEFKSNPCDTPAARFMSTCR